MSDRVNVMYAGRIVETAATAPLFDTPCHPYTQGLLASVPDLSSDTGQALHSIPGQPPDLAELPPGCAFAPRCPRARDECTAAVPAMLEPTPDPRSACLDAALLATGTAREEVSP
jgi:oligopeptide/dipeptide ABC transporter ATP-binding protein